MRGLCSYFRLGCCGVQSGSLVRLLICFGSGALLVSGAKAVGFSPSWS